MTPQDYLSIGNEVLAIAQSPRFQIAVLALIVLPTFFIGFIPRMVRTLSYPSGPTLEGVELPSKYWLLVIDVMRFILSSTAQAIIGALALLLLRYAGINLL